MSRGTLDTAGCLQISSTGLSPCIVRLSRTLRLSYRNAVMQSTTPTKQALLVWPLPLSLATTQGIDVSFSSSRYLDVSVREVCFIYL